MEILEKSLGEALHGYHDAVLRLAEVPGIGVDSAQLADLSERHRKIAWSLFIPLERRKKLRRKTVGPT